MFHIVAVVVSTLFFSLSLVSFPLALITVSRMREKNGSFFCLRCNTPVAIKINGRYYHYANFVESKSSKTENITYH